MCLENAEEREAPLRAHSPSHLAHRDCSEQAWCPAPPLPGLRSPSSPSDSSPCLTELAAPDRSSSFTALLPPAPGESHSSSQDYEQHNKVFIHLPDFVSFHTKHAPLISWWEGISLLCQTIKEMKKHPHTIPLSVLMVTRYPKEDFFPP